MDNLIELILLLEYLAEDGPELDELLVELFVKGLECIGVLRVGDEPIDRGEVLALGELLVEAPED